MIHSHGLKKLPLDKRDLKVGALFTLPSLAELPSVYEVPSEPFFKDQKYTDYCAVESGTAVSEDQELVELDPLWQFMKAKKLEGDPDGYGLDLRSAAQSFTDFGSIPIHLSPFNIDTPREVIVNPESWKGVNYDFAAEEFKKASYLFITGPYDFFDNIRATIWKFKDDNRSVEMGFDWCAEWLTTPGGVINALGTVTGGHAVKITGFVQINSIPYLKAQLSSGRDVGDKGYFYFSREVVNPQSGYGAFTFCDIDKKLLNYHQNLEVKVDLPFFVKWLSLIISFIKNLWPN